MNKTRSEDGRLLASFMISGDYPNEYLIKGTGFQDFFNKASFEELKRDFQRWGIEFKIQGFTEKYASGWVGKLAYDEVSKKKVRLLDRIAPKINAILSSEKPDLKRLRILYLRGIGICNGEQLFTQLKEQFDEKDAIEEVLEEVLAQA